MEFDHLVLGASTLAEGREYVQDSLGVLVPVGGQHQRFGTHNAVMRFASGGYFEIIAIDPDAEPEHQPRWFSLDDPDVQAQIRSEPKLLTWVVNTGARSVDDILQHLPVGKLDNKPNPLINTPMQRGALRWNMLIPESGRQSDLLFPWIIQWPDGIHPSSNMLDLHCELLSIVASHDEPASLAQSLRQIGCEQMLDIENATENAGKRLLKARIAGPGTEAVFCGLR